MDAASLVPLGKLALVFAFMLTGIRYRLGLGNSILAGSFLLAFIFGMSITDWLHTAIATLHSWDTLALSLIVGLIMLLSGTMDSTGQAARLVEPLQKVIRRPALRLTFFPALIGLLPMPGGAVFSAPMVESVAEKMDLTNEDKAVINYWFRHIWEVSWPLYPGLLISASLAKIPIGALALRNLPGFFVFIFAGWFLILRPLQSRFPAVEPKSNSREHYKLILKEGLPLIVAIIGALVFEGIISFHLPEIDVECGVLLALFLGIVCVVAQNKDGFKAARIIFARKHIYAMLYVVLAIFVFKNSLTDSGVVESLSTAAGRDTALIVSATLLPFIVGFVSGINMAVAGATFPLFLGILGPDIGPAVYPWLVLATFCGFTGVMVSPLHICFILTCRYFNTDIAGPWKRIFIPCILFFITGIALFFVYR